MRIDKTDFIDGAKNGKGIVVIIDVFRAFSVACYCFNQGAKRIIPVGQIDEALMLQQQIKDCVLAGERGGQKLPGFDHGNSPTEMQQIDLRGKTVIHTTHAGTQGLVNAQLATEVVTGSLVNAKATARYIQSRSPTQVTLVRMGWKATTPTDEDNVCADYLESLLQDKEFDEYSIRPFLQKSPCSDRFFDSAQPWNPLSDFDLCLKLNVFDFAIKVTSEEKRFLSLEMV